MHKSCININLQTLKNTSKEEKTMNLKGSLKSEKLKDLYDSLL